MKLIVAAEDLISADKVDVPLNNDPLLQGMNNDEPDEVRSSSSTASPVKSLIKTIFEGDESGSNSGDSGVQIDAGSDFPKPKDALRQTSSPLAEATLPSTALAEATLPSTALAEATLPSTALAEATLPSTALAEATLPSTALAEATLPKVSLQATTLPESTAQPAEHDYHAFFGDTDDEEEEGAEVRKDEEEEEEEEKLTVAGKNSTSESVAHVSDEEEGFVEEISDSKLRNLIIEARKDKNLNTSLLADLEKIFKYKPTGSSKTRSNSSSSTTITDDPLIHTRGNYDLAYSDMQRLEPGKWLNSRVCIFII